MRILAIPFLCLIFSFQTLIGSVPGLEKPTLWSDGSLWTEISEEERPEKAKTSAGWVIDKDLGPLYLGPDGSARWAYSVNEDHWLYLLPEVGVYYSLKQESWFPLLSWEH